MVSGLGRLSDGSSPDHASRLRISRCVVNGACYLKPTRLMGTLPDLESLGGGCMCQLPHEHLQGMTVFEDASGKRTSIWKTSLAGRCPPLLCRAAARLISRAAPASS